MAELYNPQRALHEDWKSHFVERRDDMFILPCIEGEVELNGRWMLLNIMMTMPLIKRMRPISRDKHLKLSRKPFTAKEQAKILTEVVRTLEEYGYTREELGHDIVMSTMDAHNLCYTHLGSWVGTMDIFSIKDTILQDDVRDIARVDYGDIRDKDIKRMETAFRDQCEKMEDLFQSNKLKHNVFRAPLMCGALKAKQFHQFVGSAGPRTDTDDHIFLKPVVGSFLSGMIDIHDHAIESRSAAKSTHYNKQQMPTASYHIRKIHIQNSSLRYLYPGDCGSKVYMTYMPTDSTKNNYLGKFFVDEHGQEVELTKNNIVKVIDKDILFRDPITCRYTDGYCEKCGGTITKSFSKTGHVGFLANTKTGSPAIQQVLSTKHLISTDAAVYEIPESLEKILRADSNNIYISSASRHRMKVMAFGFKPKDIAKLNDLKPTNGNRNASYFTDIKYLNIGTLKPDGTILKNKFHTPMGGRTKAYPYLSPEVLEVICQHPEDLIMQDGLYWLLLRNINPHDPIMQCTVVNNSIRQFVEDFTGMITKDVERYRSANVFMRALTDLIWSRVDVNVTHVAAIVKSCLITSMKDFHIPVVDDPDNVMFGSLLRIIPRRSIGGLLAFQSYNIATNKPITYISPKLHNVFDEFMGYTDLIERDKHWPPFSDRLYHENG